MMHCTVTCLRILYQPTFPEVHTVLICVPEVYSSTTPSPTELIGDPGPPSLASLPALLLSLDEAEEELSPAELMGLCGAAKGGLFLLSDT